MDRPSQAAAWRTACLRRTERPTRERAGYPVACPAAYTVLPRKRTSSTAAPRTAASADPAAPRHDSSSGHHTVPSCLGVTAPDNRHSATPSPRLAMSNPAERWNHGVRRQRLSVRSLFLAPGLALVSPRAKLKGRLP